VGVLGAECLCDRTADPTRGAGHDGHLSGERSWLCARATEAGRGGPRARHERRAAIAGVGREGYSQARTPPRDSPESRDKIDPNEPIESSDPHDMIDPSDKALPMDPTDRTLPTEPMERTEPFDPMDNTESVDPSENRDWFICSR
jgi:hypothetical protein